MAACHTTYSKIKHDNNKPLNDSKDTFLSSFLVDPLKRKGQEVKCGLTELKIVFKLNAINDYAWLQLELMR